jgi:hypothetical protein
MTFGVGKAVATAIFFISMIQLPLWGQQSALDSPRDYVEIVEAAYGQDQELVNGMQYYDRHPRSLGHPYLSEGWVHQGSVTIRDQLYDNVMLRYDIHSQQVEVEYRTLNGAFNQVVLVGDRVNEFTIGTKRFCNLKLEEAEEFFQVIGEARLIFYIRWEKKLVPVSGNSRFIEEFTTPKRSYLLQLDGSIAAFHNKKSLVKLFPDQMQKQLKRLFRSNHLVLRTATPEQLERFILAASGLINGGGHP